ncbi:MAG: integrase [Actinomycetota bacterium]
MATIIKRGDNWQAKVRRKGYPPLSRTFDTKVLAERWARQIEGEMDRGCFVDPTEANNTTLDAALERYGREVTPHKKGIAQEEVRIRFWRRDPLARFSLANLKPSDLAKWRDAKLKAGTGPTTVRNYLALISHLYTVAIKEWGMTSLGNPIEKIKMPSAAKARDRRLVDKEEERLLKACDASKCTWLAPIVRVALETAMRQGELLKLQWADVDLARRVAKLHDTKNGDDREVPLSTAAVAELKKLPRSLDGRVFPVTREVLDTYFRKAVTAAEIKNLKFHDLRHEATSRLFELGLNPMEAAAITGHKTLQMLKRYTHLRAEDLAEKLG